ncbi:MAG: NAD(P)-binding domain-containing protein [Bacteroidota bacterium]|nr:NAD(P)-binding domain-containing protein [Bacteroidota bacterium]MDP4216241.1 NAD(P)-binding domain-containing protein [Bacteroidota bacterium]MDP4246628.1 NAD(P)-binding domain-containing protein [Bacteroidota bacterium]MDP4254216.1 NAD(P)-binding domain-containing protein [Bacteroidota bacterium]MDP4256761.1 NAD(P)-binding domain-containing protein [Bacteroidota bacterium]
MKIGIIGSGVVGQTLGSAFLKEGHGVVLGTRDTGKEEIKKWEKENPRGEVGSFADAARSGEILVLAVGGSVTEEAIRLSGTEHFSGKVVIDATNPIAAAPPVNGVLRYFTNLDESLMERTQRLVPGARLVKAFNSVGNAVMYKPGFPGGKPTMFICGNDESARKIVTDILTDFGWETEDMGLIEAARAIEPLCMLWCIPGLARHQWTHAFKLLKA